MAIIAASSIFGPFWLLNIRDYELLAMHALIYNNTWAQAHLFE